MVRIIMHIYTPHMHIHMCTPPYAHLFEHIYTGFVYKEEASLSSVQRQPLELPWYNSVGSDVAQVFQL